jgi:hypothetical protein
VSLNHVRRFDSQVRVEFHFVYARQRLRMGMLLSKDM